MYVSCSTLDQPDEEDVCLGINAAGHTCCLPKSKVYRINEEDVLLFDGMIKNNQASYGGAVKDPFTIMLQMGRVP